MVKEDRDGNERSFDVLSLLNGEITEKNTVKVSCSHSRGIGFQDFYMSVNDEGLPFTHYIETDNVYTNLVENKTDNSLPYINPKEAFNDVPF